MKYIFSFNSVSMFAVYFITSVLLALLFAYVYVQFTEGDEFKAIKDGKVGPAFTLFGSLLGFAIPLVTILHFSANYIDFVLWGIFAGAVQFATHVAVYYSDRNAWKSVFDQNVAYGIFCCMISVVVGIFNAFCMIP